MSDAAIIVPFRDRNRDPARRANLRRVTEHWAKCGIPVHVVDDGRTGDALFNRSAAYNRAAAETAANVLVYVEADILIGFKQIYTAIVLAAAKPGLVLPFTWLHALTQSDSDLVRRHQREPGFCAAAVSDQGVGPANVISRATLDMVGCWDETFEGHGYDDLAMFVAFEVAAGPVRRVDGPAYHLHHRNLNPDDPAARLPGKDSRAHDSNYERARCYRLACSPEEIRRLTAGQLTESLVR